MLKPYKKVMASRRKVTANVQTLVRSIMKYNLSVCKLPADVKSAVLINGYLEGEVVEVFYLCAVQKFAEALAGQTDASVANKQAQVDMLKFVSDAISTAYGVDAPPQLGAIDVTLPIQQLRIVFLPSPSLLAIISLSGNQLLAPTAPPAAPTVVSPGAPIGETPREVTIKVSL